MFHRGRKNPHALLENNIAGKAHFLFLNKSGILLTEDIVMIQFSVLRAGQVK
jgi:hypothetical protein